MGIYNINYNVNTKKISFTYDTDNIFSGFVANVNYKLKSLITNQEYFLNGKTSYTIPYDYSALQTGLPATNIVTYTDVFDIPTDILGNIILGNYEIQARQEARVSTNNTIQRDFLQAFEILEYNILANNVNVDLIENCNELLISNTTNEVQYFDITSLNDLGLFVKNESISATTTLSNNVFYNRLITEVVSIPLINDIQVLQPYQYVKLILKDQLYKITWKTLTGVLNTKYVAKDCSLKECLINKLNEILCTKVGDCDNSCDLILEYLKIKAASDAIYFIWNRWSQSNIILDVSETSNYRLREYSEWLTFIEEHCSDCIKPKHDCRCH